MEQKVKALLMLEILGKPAEHIVTTLNQIIDNISIQENVKVISRKVAEPRQIEQEGKKQDAYTTYAEIEVETGIKQLMLIIFNVTPSHIEIITPEELKISNSDLNSFFNELIMRIHKYDELARVMMVENAMLAKKMNEKPSKKKKKKIKT